MHARMHTQTPLADPRPGVRRRMPGSVCLLGHISNRAHCCSCAHTSTQHVATRHATRVASERCDAALRNMHQTTSRPHRGSSVRFAAAASRCCATRTIRNTGIPAALPRLPPRMSVICAYSASGGRGGGTSLDTGHGDGLGDARERAMLGPRPVACSRICSPRASAWTSAESHPPRAE